MGYFQHGDSVNELNDNAKDPVRKSFADINKEMQYNEEIILPADSHEFFKSDGLRFCW